jgi:exodeoxyribonuclease VII large subunit
MSSAPLDLFSAQRPVVRGGASDLPLSVADVAERTRALVENRLPPVWIRGEITDFKRHKNGHWYFCLRDRVSQVRCVVWSKDQRRIPAAPDDGMQVVLFGQVTVYAARTELQVKVTRIEAEGDGLWRKAMDLTLGRLRAEGLLDAARKRPLPRYPKRVAVVTSRDAAALRDIIAVIRKRNPAVEVVLCQAKVQGDGAAREIAAAIDRVSRWSGADILIVGRGGGGKEDLWAFNDERVARAVAASPIPVVSAVGHEVDMTVCDAVADVRAPTPSAAGSMSCVATTDMQRAIAHAARDLSTALQSRVVHARQDLVRARSEIVYLAERTIVEKRGTMASAASRLNALSPLATLARGYLVARDAGGRTLSRVSHFTTGEPFEILLQDGTLDATADVIRPEKSAH